MKTITSLFIIILPTILWTQNVDSIAIMQVDSLIQISKSFTGKGDFIKATEYNEKAEKIAIESFGMESTAFANTCFNKGRIASFKDDYSEAEKWYLEAKAIRENLLGKEHPDYAMSLNNLGLLYDKTGNYEKAEQMFLESMSIREKTIGRIHHDYAGSLINLAGLYTNMGKLNKVEALYLEAKEIFETGLKDIEHPYYTNCLRNLSILYIITNKYEKALNPCLKAKNIREKVFGKEHPLYASSLSVLSILYKRMGLYEKAEAMYEEAISIVGKTKGKENSQYSSLLMNLGVLYYEMGNFENAEDLFLETKAIILRTKGTDSDIYSNIINNLAGMYHTYDNYEKAERLYIEALDIKERLFGKGNVNNISALANLGSLYRDIGNFEEAEVLMNEALNIVDQSMGKENSDYTDILTHIGKLHLVRNNHERAENIFLEAINIREKVLGKNHPYYAESLSDLAFLYHVTGQYEKAESYFVQLSAVNKLLIEKATHHLSERELNTYIHKFSGRQAGILSFTQISDSKNMVPVCYNNCLFYKGFLLQATGQLKQLALSDEDTAEKYFSLKSYQRRLAEQYAQPIAERDSALVAQLEFQSNDLEKDLTRLVVGWGDANRQVQWKEMQSTLKPTEAAVEFVHYSFFNEKETDSTMYAALILLPGNTAPSFIPLFEEKQLDSLLQTDGDRKSDYVNTLYTIAERGARPIGRPQKSLYELIWQPLEQELENIRTIYISPSGLLHRLNLSAIPLNDEETLGDQYHLLRLNSTRQLVVGSPLLAKYSKDAVLFGGVQYEMDSTAIVTANKNYDIGLMVTRGELSFSYADSTYRGGAWNYLKWTNKEVDNVETILREANFRVDTRKSFSATEESFKIIGNNNPSPRILHIATHGFFFPDPKKDVRSEIVRSEREPVFKMSDHPMIRSGLILAGGNHAWQTGKPFDQDMEDGILTAYEISQMNLSDTELIVLSACETGLGDIQGNEGVYGLQRAFKIAGAKYLVMSLWQVPDQETSIFMTTFYGHFIEDKMSIPEAFRTTQKEMRERFINPYQWAGFVLVE